MWINKTIFPAFTLLAKIFRTMMNPEFESPEMQREYEWMKSERQMHELYQIGIEKILNKEQAESLFENGESCLCCIDEGTDNGLFRVPGSAILLSEEERESLIDRLQAMGIKGVRSHEGCGAAEKYCKDNNITDKSIDEVAIEKAKELAERLHVPYFGHSEKISRPKEFHFARVVYYDGTGQFNQAASKDHLPPGFVVSRRFLHNLDENDQTENQYKPAIDSTKLAIQIALGEHGFGKKITEHKPLLLVGLGDPLDSMFNMDAMRRELQDIVENIAKTDPDIVKRLRIDVANAPTEHTRN